jgi:Delta6-protoilludene synthase
MGVTGTYFAYRFWLNACRIASKSSQKRFLKGYKAYTDAVVQQSRDRDYSYIRDIAGYFKVRRGTIGAVPSFAIHELHYDLPDAFIEHPIVKTLTLLCVDLIIIGNDILSYNIEYVVSIINYSN